MAQTLTFDKVFTATGEKNGKTWTRWDFKIGGDRYSTFKKELADKIEVGRPTDVEFTVDGSSNGYTNRTITAVLSGSKSEATQHLAPVEQGVGSGPVASQGAQADNVRGKCFTMIAAGAPQALFESLPVEEQTFEAMVQIINALVDKALAA